MIRIHELTPWPKLLHRQTEIRLWEEGRTVADYAPESALADPDVVCVRNGETISPDRWGETETAYGDDLSFAIVPTAEVSLGTLIVNAIITTIVATGVSYGINALFGEPDVDQPFENAPDPTHTFDGIRNTASAGIPITMVYGEHVVGGNILDVSIEGNNPFLTGQNYGNALDLTIGLCEGEIDAVLETKINGNPVSTYGNRVTVQHNLGTNDQSALGGGGTRALFPVGLDLPTGGGIPYTPPTWTGGEIRTYATTKPVNRAILNVTHPQGLVYVGQSSGDHYALSVQFQYRYRLTSDSGPSPSWTPWVTRAVASNIRSPFTTNEEIQFPTIDEYTIEVRKWSVNADGPTYFDDIVLDSVTEVIDSAARYPNLACTRLRIEADRSLSGGLPTITQKIRGRKIQKWDGGPNDPPNFVDAAPYNNPAWVVVDMFLDDRYGLGRWFTYRNLDLDSFLEWAEWCDEFVPDGKGGLERRCTLDAVFDGESTAWNRILQVAATARASFVIIGDLVKVKVEKPRDPVQLFTMANIRRGSWRQSWVSNRLRPTRTEVRFLNAELDYQIDEEGEDDLEALEQGLPQRVTRIDRIGITRRSQAIREARFALNLQKLTQSVEWEADIDSVLCEAGDLVRVAHDVPAWGFSGRVSDGDKVANILALDREITLEEGSTYELCLRLPDDRIELRTIVTPAGTYPAGSFFVVDAPFSDLPQEGWPYSLGKLQGSTRTVKLTDIQTAPNLGRRLRGVVYDPRIHEDEIGTLDDIVVTELPDPFQVPACPTGLAATDVPVSLGGALAVGVQVSWEYPTGGDLGSAQVWSRDVTDFLASGSSPVGQFLPAASVAFPATQAVLTSGIVEGRTYEFTVTIESSAGASRAPGDCAAVQHTVAGAGQVVPGEPTGLALSHLGDEILLSWQPVTNVQVSHYEVRRGKEWVGSLEVGQTPSTSLVTTRWAPTAGSTISESFFVRAVSHAGTYGNTAELETGAGALPVWGGTAATQRDQRALGWTGTLINVVSNGGVLELVDPAQPGVYQTAAIDLGVAGTYRIGAVWHTDQPSEFGWVSSLSWSGVPARQNNWNGFVDPDQWRNAYAIEFQASADNVTWSDFAPLITQTVPGATIGGLWVTAIRYFRVRITITPSDPDWAAWTEQLYITLESR